MKVRELQDVLLRIPEPEVPAIDEQLIESSLRYLVSADAARSLEEDCYWPKWDTPWWHMMLLYELGETRRIPAVVVDRLVASVDAVPLHIFPIHPGDRPPGSDPLRDSMCHCAVGCVHQLLSACGVDVAGRLPWLEPWFARYQMADGGANCDETAYLSEECASSMVATIAPFEATLSQPSQDYSDRAAQFLMNRRLIEGSSTRHNAAERTSAPTWLSMAFPRYYFYDVLRGINALTQWAQSNNRSLPLESISTVVEHLATSFPDGAVRIGRRPVEGKKTPAKIDGTWVRGQPVSMFPLLEGTSRIGQVSRPLTQQWTAVRHRLLSLLESGNIIAD